MRSILAIAALLALSACNDNRVDMQPIPPKEVVPPVEMAVKVAPRITVERISIFADKLAYGNERGIYIIRDAATGKEYIGVSGIGISETGSHQSGKVRQSDER